ncbi:MAG: fumarylacetoacetate hydrolase family protein [Anaerolineae bacterium]|nr:fumarylacetoacetate hydrolase family protein [Anaerolineae bacterium]
MVLQPADRWPEAAIRLTVRRAGAVAFAGETHTRRLRRSIGELVGYLGRSATFPDGAVLLTGTGIVPPAEFTLQAGDTVEIAIEGIGGWSTPSRWCRHIVGPRTTPVQKDASQSARYKMSERVGARHALALHENLQPGDHRTIA